MWTLEKKGMKPSISLSWDEARPTKTHLALTALEAGGFLDFLVTQNIDGLHMRSGMPRRRLAELHGNMFADRCTACRRMVVRASASETVGQKVSTTGCPLPRKKGSRRGHCRGRLADFVLDWEDELPDEDLDLSDSRSALAHLNVVLGSTLQIVPAGNLPLQHKKYHKAGKLVIVNLQSTKHDAKADLVIRDYVDKVMEKLLSRLGLELPEYDQDKDPVARAKADGDQVLVVKLVGTFLAFPHLYLAACFCFPQEWTQDAEEARRMKALADAMDDKYRNRRREERKRAAEAKKAREENRVEYGAKEEVMVEEALGKGDGEAPGEKIVNEGAPPPEVKVDVKEVVKTEENPHLPNSNGYAVKQDEVSGGGDITCAAAPDSAKKTKLEDVSS